MMIFEDIDDLLEWLNPLGYIAFWDAVEPYAVFSHEDREHCDERIACGAVETDLVLNCLKATARVQLTERFKLNHRIHEPVQAQYLASVQ